MAFEQADRYDDWFYQEILAKYPALPHDHSYLQLLRGESKDDDGLIGRLSIQDNGEEAHVENDDSSEVDNMLQTLLKDWSQDWSRNMENEDLRFPEGKPRDYRLKVRCGRCSKSEVMPRVYFCCRECNFYICEDCALSGKRCNIPRHVLRLVKSMEIAFNSVVTVPAKAIHSMRSDLKDELPASVNTTTIPDVNLRAILGTYIQQSVMTLKPECRSGLGENLRVHLFEGETEDEIPFEFLITRYINCWRVICHLLAHQHYEPRLDSFLTPEHMDVIRLLLEWWLGDIQHFRLSQIALSGFLFGACYPATPPLDLATLSGSTRSEYQKALVVLFRLEFQSPSPDPSVLRSQRNEASRHASVQRLGFAYVCGNMDPLWHKPAENMYRTAWEHLKSIPRSMRPSLIVCEKVNARETLRFAVEVLKAYHGSMELAIENLRSAQQILGPKSLNASIAPCWWIPQAKKLAYVPYYLWDKEGRRTVCTKAFRYLPEYTVVSHTWGRWKSEHLEGIQLPNVPWKVPPNGLFSVQDLGDILNGVPGCNRYVWFDLVCIPQTPDDAELKAIEKQEIARQAAIFSHADTAVAWLSTIDEFGPLEDICHMLAMNVVRYPGQFDYNHLIECLERLSTLNTKLMKEPLFTPLARPGLKPGSNYLHWDQVLHEWFSSLWTLQETCMRPDMSLCTRSWEPLKSHASGTVIPLDCILALIRVNTTKFSIDNAPIPNQSISSKQALQGLTFCEYETHEGATLIKSPPRCLHNFIMYASSAALIDIPGIERIRIITMGNQRECRRYRAEAIMAVLDVTDWFEEQESLPDDERQIVLERYPMIFVNKVRQKLGDDLFFGSDIARDFWLQLDEDQISITQIEKLKVKGTLLPFSEDRSRNISRLSLRNDQLPYVTREPHPELTDWHIEANGSVTVPKASVLMSSFDSSDSDLLFNIVDHHDIARKDRRIPQEMVKMKDWMSTRFYKCYAVTLQRTKPMDKNYYRFSGVILREVDCGVLIKTGNFVTSWFQAKDLGWSNPQEVNWTVL